jgi:hypothetical protein
LYLVLNFGLVRTDNSSIIILIGKIGLVVGHSHSAEYFVKRPRKQTEEKEGSSLIFKAQSWLKLPAQSPISPATNPLIISLSAQPLGESSEK